MNSGTPYIGTKISLISKSEIKYEGILYAIDTKNATVTLANVRSFGTEDREVEKYIAPRDEQFEFIVFRGQDIKDLHVCEAPQQKQERVNAHLPQDPAIVQIQRPTALPKLKQGEQLQNSGPRRASTCKLTGLPNSSYAPYHTPPVSYPQVPSFSPYGSLPSYSGYPPGLVHRPAMPGRMQHPMGMMPPGPMMQQRIGTPPSVAPMAMTRTHTPSPETVLPVPSSASTGNSKAEDTHPKNTSQQATQTVTRKKRPSSRPSSRRNSEDRTVQQPQEQKKEEVKVEKEKISKETENKESTAEHPAPQLQRQRQSGNRRSQGRRGTSTTRGSRTRPGGSSVKFEGEFDFESSNAKFNKEEIEEEIQQKLHDNLRITNEDENTVNGMTETDTIQDRSETEVSYYDSSKSFFDSISCEAVDRDRNRRAHPSWQQERKVNLETFGVTGGLRQGGRGRGRGRGGFRGGRGGNRDQRQDEGSAGWRGGYRGGRGGSRGGRSRGGVNYRINKEDKLPPKSLTKGSPVASGGKATAKA